MSTPGKMVAREPLGKAGVLASGKRAVFRSDGDCPACCEEYVCDFPVQVTLEADVVMEGQAFDGGDVVRDTWGNETWKVDEVGVTARYEKLATEILITITYYIEPRNEWEMTITIWTSATSDPQGEYYMEATSPDLCGTWTINEAFGFNPGYISGDITGVTVV